MTQKGRPEKGLVLCREVSYSCDQEERSGGPGDEYLSEEGLHLFRLIYFQLGQPAPVMSPFRASSAVFICKMGVINNSRLGGGYEVIGGA